MGNAFRTPAGTVGSTDTTSTKTTTLWRVDTIMMWTRTMQHVPIIKEAISTATQGTEDTRGSG